MGKLVCNEANSKRAPRPGKRLEAASESKEEKAYASARRGFTSISRGARAYTRPSLASLSSYSAPDEMP